MGQKMEHAQVTLPKNAKRSDSKKAVFVGSQWITSGVLRVNTPEYRPAVAPGFFVKSPWIKTGILKVNMPGYRPAAISRVSVCKGSFKGSNAVFVRSPWITSFGIFPVEKMNHSIECSLRLVAVLVSVNQDRIPLAHLKAA